MQEKALGSETGQKTKSIMINLNDALGTKTCRNELNDHEKPK